MFSSIFSTSDPRAPNLHPVTNGLTPSDIFSPLTPNDLDWVLASGFSAETHIWYNILEDGTFLMCQIIHTSLGLWYPTVQFTCRLYNPTTKKDDWKSVNVSNFVTPRPGSTDKKTSKSDRFDIDFKPGEDTYVISANLADDFQVSLNITRTAEGFKVGKGPKGGYTYFGADKENPDGTVFHKFWPATKCSGTVIVKGQAIAANGTGMVVHAIQGMRPDKVATRWNFARFESPEHGGVSATMMEFTTTPEYGKTGAKSGGVVVNVGGVVVGGKLITVTAETRWPGETPDEGAVVKSRAFHYDTKHDPDTSYDAPTRLSFHWAGPSVASDAPGTVKADLDLPVGDPAAYSGLIKKIDVLGEIPAVIKAVIAYAAGTKPFIYTWLNPATLSVNMPSGEAFEAKGVVFNEASFVS